MKVNYVYCDPLLNIPVRIFLIQIFSYLHSMIHIRKFNYFKTSVHFPLYLINSNIAALQLFLPVQCELICKSTIKMPPSPCLNCDIFIAFLAFQDTDIFWVLLLFVLFRTFLIWSFSDISYDQIQVRLGQKTCVLTGHLSCWRRRSCLPSLVHNSDHHKVVGMWSLHSHSYLFL